MPSTTKLHTSRKPKLVDEIEECRFEKIASTTSVPHLQHDRNIVIDISRQVGYCINLAAIKLYVRARILNIDKSLLADTEPAVAFQSAPLYTMFRDVQIYINNTPVFYGKFNYPYFCQNLIRFKMPLTESNVVNESVLVWDDHQDLDASYEDSALIGYSGEAMDEFEDMADRFSNSSYVELQGPFLSDFSFIQMYLRDDCDVRIVLTPVAPEFALLACKFEPAPSYCIEIDHCTAIVPRIKVKPSYRLPSEYSIPFVEHSMQMFVIAKDSTNYTRNIMTGPIPRRLLIAFTKETSYNGSYIESAFAFPHFSLNFVQVTAGGRLFPNNPLIMQFDQDEYLQCYYSLYDNMERNLHEVGGLFLSRYQFSKQNRFFLAFNLTPDKESGSEHYSRLGTGQASIQLGFSKPLPQNVVMVMMAEYERELKLGANGKVTIQYPSAVY